MNCTAEVCYHIYVKGELWTATSDINVHQEMLNVAHEVGYDPTEERVKNRV